MYCIGDYVEVNQATQLGGLPVHTWFGQITAVLDGTPTHYAVRKGGESRILTVSSALLRLHPAKATARRTIARQADPARVGIEIEDYAAHVEPQDAARRKDASIVQNGITVAQSPDTEMAIGTRKVKLDTEGAKDGHTNMCIEINYGALPLATYSQQSFIKAQKKLFAIIGINKDSPSLYPGQNPVTLRDALTLYNSKLQGPEVKYRVDIQPIADVYRLQRKHEKNLYRQTNIAMPYDRIANHAAFQVLLNTPSQTKDLALHQAATKFASDTTANMPATLTANVRAFIAHLFFHMGPYLRRRIVPGKEVSQTKYQFFAFIKASLMDVIFTILTQDEAQWLAAQPLWDQLGTELRKVREFSSGGEAFGASGRPGTVLGPAIDLIRRGLTLRAQDPARQLLLPCRDDEPISLLTAANVVTTPDPPLFHFHPRPTARIPIYTNSDGRRFFVVVEQRVDAHAFNSNLSGSVTLIANLQS